MYMYIYVRMTHNMLGSVHSPLHFLVIITHLVLHCLQCVCCNTTPQ